MPVSNLSAIVGGLLPGSYGAALQPERSNDNLGGFTYFFNDALENARAADRQEKVTQLDLLTGLSDDFSGLLLDSEKATIALNLTLQIRNRILEAYNEIMRMQV